MDRDQVLAYCDEIDGLVQQIREEMQTAPSPIPPLDPITELTRADDLQAALDAGGRYSFAAQTAFEDDSGFAFTADGTTIYGEGGAVTGGRAPAFSVRTGRHSIGLERLLLAATDYEVVLRAGVNDSGQTTVEQAPQHLLLRALVNAGHRGKRCIEINARDVQILDCEVRDLYDPGNLDSQAIWIGNAPGPVSVSGGYFEAASECLMVGGDQMKIPNCRPTGITIRQALFAKPAAWQAAGIKVKNILELKDGHDVLIDTCQLAGCWPSAQDGYGFMLTPTRGGSLVNVVIRNCQVSDVAAIVNITGIDTNYPNEPRSQITFEGGEYYTNPARGGPGRFALVGRGPEWLKVEGAVISHHGSAFIDVSDSKPMGLLRVVNSTWNYGKYGIRIAGYNHGDNSQGVVGTVQIEGNTISGAHSQFIERYPNNTYIGAYKASGWADWRDRLELMWPDLQPR